MAITVAPVQPGATGAFDSKGSTNSPHFKYGFVDITFDTENLSTGEDVSAIETYLGFTLVGMIEMGSADNTNNGFVYKLDTDGKTLVVFYQAGRTATTVTAGVLITAASANLATNPGTVRFLCIGY